METPTTVLVNNYLKAFENNPRNNDGDHAIETAIHQFPNHNKVEEVLIKVCLINTLYSTSVFNTHQMARHIVTKDLGDQIKEGVTEAVEKIATGHKIGLKNGKERHFYSFATKYCNWHNHEAYPILDNYVSEVLKAYRNQDGFSKFKNGDLRNYPRFKSIMEDFRRFYQLKAYNLKQLDKFLWSYGKALFN